MPRFAFSKEMTCEDIFLNLVSTMTHVEDEYKRKEYAQVVQYKSLVEELHTRGIEAMVGADVVDFRPYQQLETEFNEYALQGYLSGKILLLLYWMHKSKKTVSLNKAFDMALSTSVRSEINKIGLSRTSLKKYWKKYKHISHYYAASKVVFYGLDEESEACCERILSEMMCVGEFFRLFGETHYTGKNHTQTHILDSEQTWRLPEFLNISPPEDIPFELDPENHLEKIYARENT